MEDSAFDKIFRDAFGTTDFSNKHTEPEVNIDVSVIQDTYTFVRNLPAVKDLKLKMTSTGNAVIMFKGKIINTFDYSIYDSTEDMIESAKITYIKKAISGDY